MDKLMTAIALNAEERHSSAHTKLIIVITQATTAAATIRAITATTSNSNRCNNSTAVDSTDTHNSHNNSHNNIKSNMNFTTEKDSTYISNSRNNSNSNKNTSATIAATQARITTTYTETATHIAKAATEDIINNSSNHTTMLYKAKLLAHPANITESLSYPAPGSRCKNCCKVVARFFWSPRGTPGSVSEICRPRTKRAVWTHFAQSCCSWIQP